MAIPIAATLSLNTARFVGAAKGASRALKPIAGGLGVVAGMAGKAAFAFTALATVTSALIIRQTSLTARLVDTSNKLGVGVGFLQKFRYAAEQTGVGVETADMALQRFTRRVAEAAQGTGEARGALLQMGIQLRDSDGRLRSTQDVLFDVADALQDTESESEKLRLAFKLFDSEGVALVNTLDQGSEKLKEFFESAQGLGFVLSQDAAQGVKNFDDSLTDLRYLISGLTSQLTAALAPALESLTDKFVEFVKSIAEEQGGFEKLGEYLKDKFLDILKNVTLGFINLYNIVVQIINNLGSALQKFGVLGNEADDVAQALDILNQMGKGPTINLGGVIADMVSFRTASQEVKDILEEVLGDSGIIVSDQERLAAIERLKAKLAELGSQGITAGGQLIQPISPETILSYEAFFDSLKEKTTEAATKVDEEVKIIAKNVGFSFEKVLDVLFGQERMTKFWNVFDDEASTAIDKLQAGMQVIFGEEGMGRLRERLEDIVNVSKTLEDGFVKAADMMTDSLTKFIKTGKLSFSDLADHIKTVLIEAFVQKAIMGPLLGLLGLGGGGGGGLVSGFMSLFTGKANGGPVSANKPYIVGERGPELFVPGGSGSIIPNNQMGMGATQVTYNINAVDAASFKTMVARDPEFIYSVSQAGARRLPR